MWQLLTSLFFIVLLPAPKNDNQTPQVEWRVVWQKAAEGEKAQLIRAENYYPDGKLKQVKDYLKEKTTVFKYDSAGKVREERGEQTGWGSYLTQYDSSLVLRTEKLENGSTRKIYHFYNEKGQLYDERHYQNDSVYLHVKYKYNTWDSLTEISYHRMPWTKDVTTKRTLMSYDPSTRKRTRKYEYDYEGLLVEETYYEYQYGSRLIAEKVITHLPQGDITYEVKYTKAGKVEEIIHAIPYEYRKTTKSFSYNERGKLTKTTETTFRDGLPQNTIIAHFYYTPEGVPTKTETVEQSVDGTRLSSSNIFYNEFGYIENEVIENSQGRTQLDYMYVYYH